MPRRLPDYERIAADLRARIRSGELPAGSKLPTRQELAVAYGVSLQPVVAALRELEYEGLVAGHQGKGVFVAEHPPHPPQEGDAT